jgi:peptidoglycan hydrolase-like protein with peptidoglycan-binding domain
MSTAPGSSWAFFFSFLFYCGVLEWMTLAEGGDFALTKRVWAGTRTLLFSAAIALALTCATASAAQASPQSPAGAASTSQPPASKSAASAQKTQTPTAASNSKSTGTSHTASTGKRPTSRRKKTVRVRGQQKIDADRTQAIQEALIREHYLTGEATGKWTQGTEDALRRYQADHGWQSKTVPDSRALIKLGLGPSHDHLLNPESAMTTAPDAPRATSLTPASHSAEPGPHMNSDAPAAAVPAPATTPTHDAPAPQ